MAYYSLILCITYAIYLLLGGFMFMHLEWEEVLTIEVEEPTEWTKLKELAITEKTASDKEERHDLAVWLLNYCGDNNSIIIDLSLNLIDKKGVQLEALEEVEKSCPKVHIEYEYLNYTYPWSYIDSLYFSMTATTTIGYGHISPSTSTGRIMCIVYSLIGIPLTGLLLALTSAFFGERLFRLFKNMFSQEQQSSRFFIAFVSVFYVVVGFIVFIFLPAFVFMALEDWTYLEAVYFGYITLTTIGFGDFVTGKNMTDQEAWLYVYQIGVILWIMIGLGYWIMVANFIQRALKSKQLIDFAKKASQLQKKLMKNDPQFLSHTSKNSINFLLNLSNILVAPELQTHDNTTGPNTGPGGHTRQIPGIAALFQQAGIRHNMNSVLTAGVMGINLKTDANGNNKEDTNSPVSSRDEDDENQMKSQFTKVTLESDLKNATSLIRSSLSSSSELLCKTLSDIESATSDEEAPITTTYTRHNPFRSSNSLPGDSIPEVPSMLPHVDSDSVHFSRNNYGSLPCRSKSRYNKSVKAIESIT